MTKQIMVFRSFTIIIHGFSLQTATGLRKQNSLLNAAPNFSSCNSFTSFFYHEHTVKSTEMGLEKNVYRR